MDRYAELILKLLEIQVGSRPRSPELIAEDERLMEGLERRYQAGLSYRCSDFRQDPDQLSPVPPREAHAKSAARSSQKAPTWNGTQMLRHSTSHQMDEAA
jgi:hypothetical protein